jgi:hypothetical protein
MSIKLIPHIAAPAVVTVADLLTLEYKPTWNEGVDYALTAIGYLVGGLGLVKGGMGDFVTNLGVSSLPLTARHIRDRVKGGAAARPVGASHYAFRSSPIRQTVVPEFEAVKLS